MKKIVLAIALVLAIGLGAKAQIGVSDAFINDWTQSDIIRDGGFGFLLPGLPFEHGGLGDVPAPLGNGLLILSALGAGYAIKKKKKQY